MVKRIDGGYAIVRKDGRHACEVHRAGPNSFKIYQQGDPQEVFTYYSQEEVSCLRDALCALLWNLDIVEGDEGPAYEALREQDEGPAYEALREQDEACREEVSIALNRRSH